MSEFVGCAGVAEVETMAQIVRVESSGNPFAIGVVGARLQRQPVNLQEAVQTVQQLEKSGFNYSIGLSQVNRFHFRRLGWSANIKRGFDVCGNLQAGAEIYVRCKQGAARAVNFSDPDLILRSALSCYYSGNYVDGIKLGYVDRVIANQSIKGIPRNAPLSRSMFD